MHTLRACVVHVRCIRGEGARCRLRAVCAFAYAPGKSARATGDAATEVILQPAGRRRPRRVALLHRRQDPGRDRRRTMGDLAPGGAAAGVARGLASGWCGSGWSTRSRAASTSPRRSPTRFAPRSRRGGAVRPRRRRRHRRARRGRRRRDRALAEARAARS